MVTLPLNGRDSLLNVRQNNMRVEAAVAMGHPGQGKNGIGRARFSQTDSIPINAWR
jgi:hypothetical protein